MFATTVTTGECKVSESDMAVELHGSVKSNGRPTITSMGFCFGLNKNMPDLEQIRNVDWADVVYCDQAGLGDFVCKMPRMRAGLMHDTLYYVKAFAANKYGVVYGETMSVRTPAEYLYFGSGSEATMGSQGGVIYIDLMSNTSWSVSSNQYWCRALKTEGTGDARLAVSVGPADLFVTTTATLTFVTDGGVTVTFFIHRNGREVVVETLSVSPQSKTFSAAGGSFTMTVSSTTSWLLTSNRDWCVAAQSSGVGNAMFLVAVAANESNTADNATITVSTASGSVTQIVAVSREGNTPSGGTVSGHDYVDLGLPSGTLWATCNVGVDSPEEYGDYFAWGETQPKSNYSWSTYKYGTSYTTLTKYCSNSSYGLNGFTDTKTVLDPEDDAATANWGNNWRMPTFDEIDELYNNCTSVWTTQGGKNGRLFTGPNGNTLFLPAAGYYYGSGLFGAASGGLYWSSSLYTGTPSDACYLFFGSDYVGWDGIGRYYGRSVRPVVR